MMLIVVIGLFVIVTLCFGGAIVLAFVSSPRPPDPWKLQNWMVEEQARYFREEFSAKRAREQALAAYQEHLSRHG